MKSCWYVIISKYCSIIVIKKINKINLHLKSEFCKGVIPQAKTAVPDISSIKINWLLPTTCNFLWWWVTSIFLNTSASHSLEEIMKSCLSIPSTPWACHCFRSYHWYNQLLTASCWSTTGQLSYHPQNRSPGNGIFYYSPLLQVKRKTEPIFFSLRITANACHLYYSFIVII